MFEKYQAKSRQDPAKKTENSGVNELIAKYNNSFPGKPEKQGKPQDAKIDKQLEERIKKLEAKGRRRGKSFSVIGLAGGFFIAVAIIYVSYLILGDVSSISEQADRNIDEISALSRQMDSKPHFKKNWKACEQDSDCIEASRSCCSCREGGDQTAISKDFFQVWQEELNSKCSRIECPQENICQNGRVLCEEGFCEFKPDSGAAGSGAECGVSGCPGQDSKQFYFSRDYGFSITYPESFSALILPFASGSSSGFQAVWQMTDQASSTLFQASVWKEPADGALSGWLAQDQATSGYYRKESEEAKRIFGFSQASLAASSVSEAELSGQPARLITARYEVCADDCSSGKYDLYSQGYILEKQGFILHFSLLASGREAWERSLSLWNGLNVFETENAAVFSLDEYWNIYANYRLGLSFKYPKQSQDGFYLKPEAVGGLIDIKGGRAQSVYDPFSPSSTLESALEEGYMILVGAVAGPERLEDHIRDMAGQGCSIDKDLSGNKGDVRQISLVDGQDPCRADASDYIYYNKASGLVAFLRTGKNSALYLPDGSIADSAIADSLEFLQAGPEDLDLDDDGLSNAEEMELGTGIDVPDTDGDGYSDGQERQSGYNPLGPG